MELKFRVAGRVARSVEDVFDAIVDPDKLSGYFTTGGAKGRLKAGATVTWDFHDFPGAFPVRVIEVEKNQKIVLNWDADNGGETRVTMVFTALEDGRTLLQISEEGWTENQEGLKASYGNCEGWTGMLCALKAYLEHGINLREGFYK